MHNSVQKYKDIISAINRKIEEQKINLKPKVIAVSKTFKLEKIIPLIELVSKEPTDIIIFPWNIKKEIAANLRQVLSPETRFWCAIPSMHEVEI